MCATCELGKISISDSPEVRVFANPKLIFREETVVCVTSAKPDPQAK
jgi:hypothetical protein